MKSGLLIFILLSTLVHAAIISTHEQWEINLSENHEQGSPSINVEVLTISQKKIEPINTITRDVPLKPSPIKMPIKHITKAQPEKIIPEKITSEEIIPKEIIPEKTTPEKKISHKIISKKTAPPDLALNAPNKNTLNNKKKSENNEKITSLLNNELSKHFYYPKAAQRKNKQGRVILAFSINSDGYINNIRINKSSGSNILDNAAINALHKIDAKENLAKALHGNSSEQVLPITYKLTAN